MGTWLNAVGLGLHAAAFEENHIDGTEPRVETKAGVAWVPAPPTRLIGRGWPELGAACSTIWC